MNPSMAATAYVVATKDRPGELRRLIVSLERQTEPPGELIVVDSGRSPVELLCQAVRAFPVRFVRALPPSAARQRNLGIAAARPETGLIGFFDDDAVLEATALEAMNRFWRTAGPDVGGASFNMLNHPQPELLRLKLMPLAEAAGLYSRRPGAVTRAGFQTMIGRPRSNIFVDWLPSGASVWRREVFDRILFDERFEGYGYLEDLDFSYRAGKAYRLAVVAEAGYFHLPAAGGRGNGYEFGRREVANRLYFVRKNAELSAGRCLLALAVRLAMTLGFAVRDGNPDLLCRAWGNAVGLATAIGRL
jgi:GT2 family glycosyltransferase